MTLHITDPALWAQDWLHEARSGGIHLPQRSTFAALKCRLAPDQAALLVIELGIDGNLIHQVGLDMNWCEDGDLYGHGRDPVRVLSDAITTLETLRDRLDRMARA